MRFDGLWWRQFAYLGCVYGPEWWKRYSPPGFATAIFLLVGANRRGAIENMGQVLGADGVRAAWGALRMYAAFSHCMTETMEYFGPRPKPFRIDLPKHDLLAEAIAEGRGAIMLTGHFGNWDVAAKTLQRYDRPVNMVMAREANASTQEFVRRARIAAGVRVIYSDTSVFSSLNIIRALRQNEIIAIQLDRMVRSGGARAVPFFGRPAAFPSGPFQLARLSGAPLIPVFVPRLGTRHYAVHLGGRFSLAREAREARELDRVMSEVVGVFERMVRAFPTQWFQFTPFWSGEVAAAPRRRGQGDGQRAGGRSQETEDRRQKPEFRIQNSESRR
jgi:KDO2-lipid IV(A) lauroyltransferase